MHVREYLDHPQLRHIFLVSDPGDGSDEQRVASVVEQTTRFNFYKITISQGIVLDPRHPDQATVFALVVGPRELDSLRDRLRTALHERVEEEPAEPGVVTRLADIGQVEACPPSPAADMEIPREALAYKPVVPGAVGDGPEPPACGTPRADRRPDPRAGAQLAGRGAPWHRSLVVLVWVSRSSPGLTISARVGWADPLGGPPILAVTGTRRPGILLPIKAPRTPRRPDVKRARVQAHRGRPRLRAWGEPAAGPWRGPASWEDSPGVVPGAGLKDWCLST